MHKNSGDSLQPEDPCRNENYERLSKKFLARLLSMLGLKVYSDPN
jgi:hypothetical protein